MIRFRRHSLKGGYDGIYGHNREAAARPAEREELLPLRKENRILAEEREILTEAAAFFAKQSL